MHGDLDDLCMAWGAENWQVLRACWSWTSGSRGRSKGRLRIRLWERVGSSMVLSSKPYVQEQLGHAEKDSSWANMGLLVWCSRVVRVLDARELFAGDVLW